MRIAVELPYYDYGARGPSQYGENLVQALGRVSPDDEFLAFAYFHRDYERKLGRLARLESANVRLAVRRWPQRLVDLAERSLGYPFVERRFAEPEGLDVFHDCGAHPSSGRVPVVYFIHGAPMDLIRVDPWFERVILPVMLKARRLIALSACIRDFMLKHYPVDPARLCVIPYGVDHDVFRPIQDAAELSRVRGLYSLPERFLLAVGPFQFRDNIEHLLRTLSDLRGDARLKGVKLVLAGGLEEHGAVLARRARELGVEGDVHFPGYIPHKDLAAVYNLAEAFVHLSYYEEFGAQLLEACACGTPILSSDAGGIRESAGDAPVYFSPHRLDGFQAALFRVLESQALRAELRGRGLEWSSRFSWEDAARRTLEIYRAASRDR